MFKTESQLPNTSNDSKRWSLLPAERDYMTKLLRYETTMVLRIGNAYSTA